MSAPAMYPSAIAAFRRPKRRACSQLVEPALGNDDAGDPVPALRRALVPEPRDLRLHRGAHHALLASEPLHLMVVPRIELARERRGWPQPELPGHAHRERHHLPPLRKHRRPIPRGPSCVGDGRVGGHRVRVWPPLSRLCPRRVRHLRGGPVGLPKRQHGHGGRLPRANPVLLRSAIRNLHERGRVGGVRPLFPLGLLLGGAEPRECPDENLAHGRGHRGTGRGAGLGPPL